jgi:hypothetical protein
MNPFRLDYAFDYIDGPVEYTQLARSMGKEVLQHLIPVLFTKDV